MKEDPKFLPPVQKRQQPMKPLTFWDWIIVKVVCGAITLADDIKRRPWDVIVTAIVSVGAAYIVTMNWRWLLIGYGIGTFAKSVLALWKRM